MIDDDGVRGLNSLDMRCGRLKIQVHMFMDGLDSSFWALLKFDVLVHIRKEDALAHRLSAVNAVDLLTGVLAPAREAISSVVPGAIFATTVSSISAALVDLVRVVTASPVPPLNLSDYNVPDAEVRDGPPTSPPIIFETEELDTTPERQVGN
ncbi:hypothetical protein Tco_0666825 [Tanacetum coccineum]